MEHRNGRRCDCDECCTFVEHIKRTVDEWPTLTDHQIDMLVTVLRAARIRESDGKARVAEHFR